MRDPTATFGPALQAIAQGEEKSLPYLLRQILDRPDGWSAILELLAYRQRSIPKQSAIQTLLTHLENALVTDLNQYFGFLAQWLRLLPPSTIPERRLAELALRLVRFNRQPQLSTFLKRLAVEPDLISFCWFVLQEMVLQQKFTAADEPFVQLLSRSRQVAEHPLAQLPVRLLWFEEPATAFQPVGNHFQLGYDNISHFNNKHHPWVYAHQILHPEKQYQHCKEMLATEYALACQRLFADWHVPGHFVFETRQYRFSGPLRNSVDLLEFLVHVELHCKHQLVPSSLACRSLSMSAAYTTLFQLHAGGGVHFTGLPGALARWAAWTQFAQMLHLPAPLALRHLTKDPAAVQWWGIRMQSGWFFTDPVSYHLGLCVYLPQAQQLSLFFCSNAPEQRTPPPY